MTTTLTPAEYRLTVEKIEKVNARAAKRGFTGRVTLEAERRTVTEKKNGFEVSYEVYDVAIGGEAPKYNGWTFVATLDWDQHAGLIVRTAPGVGSVDREGLREGWCDHCKTNRRRTATYLVRDEQGKQVQVGSTCIKDFLGWQGSVVFIYADDIEREVSEGWGIYADRDYSTLTVLAVAWAAIKAYGFVPASSSFDGKPTKEVVMTVLRPGKGKADQQIVADVQPFVADAADEALKVRDFILSDDFSGDSEYVTNLKAIAAAKFTTDRNVGMLASAPQALARFNEQTLVRKAREQQPSEWIGAVKDKIEFTGTVETVRFIEGNYGTTVLYQIRNEETGVIVKWFASRAALGDQTGVEVTIKATVKGHDEYNGVKSTLVTRAKAL